jgi:hypothetical protein
MDSDPDYLSVYESEDESRLEEIQPKEGNEMDLLPWIPVTLSQDTESAGNDISDSLCVIVTRLGAYSFKSVTATATFHKNKLNLMGYSYSRMGSSNYWKCAEQLKYQCCANLTMCRTASSVSLSKKNHTHDPDNGEPNLMIRCSRCTRICRTLRLAKQHLESHKVRKGFTVI